MLKSNRNVLSKFCQETSISGLSNAGIEGKSRIRKTLWVLIFLLGLAATAWTLFEVINSFLQYPTTTSITFSYRSKVRVQWLKTLHKTTIKTVIFFIRLHFLELLFATRIEWTVKHSMKCWVLVRVTTVIAHNLNIFCIQIMKLLTMQEGWRQLVMPCQNPSIFCGQLKIALA